MRKVVSLAVLFAAVSMLFLNAAAEIGIIESPNIDIIQMETEQLDEAWLYKHVEAVQRADEGDLHNQLDAIRPVQQL